MRLAVVLVMVADDKEFLRDLARDARVLNLRLRLRGSATGSQAESWDSEL